MFTIHTRNSPTTHISQNLITVDKNQDMSEIGFEKNLSFNKVRSTHSVKRNALNNSSKFIRFSNMT